MNPFRRFDGYASGRFGGLLQVGGLIGIRAHRGLLLSTISVIAVAAGLAITAQAVATVVRWIRNRPAS